MLKLKITRLNRYLYDFCFLDDAPTYKSLYCATTEFSIKANQTLIDIRFKYACTNSILYNESETQCMAF